jgi:hypothetical protein
LIAGPVLDDRLHSMAMFEYHFTLIVIHVREWFGQANIATMRIYDYQRTRPEDSPTFKVTY